VVFSRWLIGQALVEARGVYLEHVGVREGGDRFSLALKACFVLCAFEGE
jgi:hypothetical protein